MVSQKNQSRSSLPAARSGGVWVVVPAYNEAEYIETVLRKIKKHHQQVIVVSDGSRDATVALARQFTPHVLHHPVNLGKGAALKTGCDFAFQKCGASAVILLDGDDQHDPACLPKFISALQTSDVVFGVRDLTQMPRLRTLGNRFGSVMVWLFFGRFLPDIPSGYKAFTNRVYPKLRWNSMGYSVEMELAARVARYRIPVVAVPIPTIYHDFNRGMTMLDILNMLGLLVNWRLTL